MSLSPSPENPDLVEPNGIQEFVWPQSNISESIKALPPSLPTILGFCPSLPVIVSIFASKGRSPGDCLSDFSEACDRVAVLHDQMTVVHLWTLLSWLRSIPVGDF